MASRKPGSGGDQESHAPAIGLGDQRAAGRAEEGPSGGASSSTDIALARFSLGK